MEVVDIAEKRPQRKPKATRPGKKVLKCKKGSTIEFPVPDDHPHNEFQEIAPLKSPQDLTPFVPLWEGRARAAGREFPGVESAFGALNAVVAEDLLVTRIQANDLIVPEGTTLVFTNPLNHLQFDNAEIKGDLVCKGDLVLECGNLS